MTVDVSLFVEAVRAVLPADGGPFQLHEPRLSERAARYVAQCVETSWVSTAGGFVTRFEDQLTQLTGAKVAIATVNGTTALHAALVLAGVQPGDEVFVPALTFAATANAVLHAGATPHFIDVDARGSLDPEALRDRIEETGRLTNGELRSRETGRPLRAVVVMHAFGHPAQTESIATLCKDAGLTLVEDAAQGVGSRQNGQHIGLTGRLSTLSFNGNKIVTTGGGGAILSMDEELGKKVRHLTSTGRRPHPFLVEHDAVAWNYRLPNLNAALGCAQLEELDSMLVRKRELASRYEQAIDDLPGVTLLTEPPDSQSNHWLVTALLDDPDKELRDRVLMALQKRGIVARAAWTPLSSLGIYDSSPRGPDRGAQDLFARAISLPSSPWLAS